MSRWTTICSCGKRIAHGTTCECKKEARRLRNLEKDKQKPDEKKFFNSKRWKVLRKRIIERDGACCQRCLNKYNIVTTSSLQVHHIKPRVKYDELKYEPSNLVTLCQTCNTQLGTAEQLDFHYDMPNEDDYVPVL